MIVIVDANIIISAIVNPKGILAELLLQNPGKIDFAAPSFLKEEVLSKKNRLCLESGMTEKYFLSVLKIYYQNILFISADTIDEIDLRKANLLTNTIDVKDSLYVALTIALEGILWTGDLKLQRGLIKKGMKNIILTKELIQIIKGL